MQSVPANSVIPTRYRAKIAHTHGYPLGAEAISAALADVPQFAKLAISFHEDYSKRGMPWPDLTSYRVLRVSYRKIFDSSPADKPVLELDWSERNWEIEVNPVPRSRKHLIKELLQKEALPVVHAWFLKDPGNRMGRHNIAFSFSEQTETLTLEEDSKLEPSRVR